MVDEGEKEKGEQEVDDRRIDGGGGSPGIIGRYPRTAKSRWMIAAVELLCLQSSPNCP